jgi:hypothetical protein
MTLAFEEELVDTGLRLLVIVSLLISQSINQSINQLEIHSLLTTTERSMLTRAKIKPL